MPRYSGKQGKGAAAVTRQRMRREAEARQRAERERDQRHAAEHPTDDMEDVAPTPAQMKAASELAAWIVFTRWGTTHQ